ncbi:MAG TPA: 1,4-alpha-glucan branching protein GlgB [Terriglobales bacterium]|nr:1,4-alpha-glucan branching protein GlgB [Terriglobales bacterium]
MAPLASQEQASRALTSYDLHLFNEGKHTRLYDKLGAHVAEVNGRRGTYFAVWAPNAERVSVVGDFNDWNPDAHPMIPRESSGVWDAFVPDLGQGTVYKYHIRSRYHLYKVDKADPYAFYNEVPPRTASIVWDLSYEWGDGEWMRTRHEQNRLEAPISIYEVHLGSWMRVPEENNRSLTYREIAPKLADYVHEMGFTHVELLPVMEHPFYGSWGYQVTGYYAPSARYGTPQDFMYLVDHLHQRGIGVILDWVPSHFPNDEHGLAYFDGTHLYEHADPRKGFHPDWKSAIFNYDRNEVRAFLISNALFWLDRYHADGLRMDAIASMLYLDYSRQPGEWIPNQYGGNENLGAISFLREVNREAYENFPDIQTIAEESTAWAMVSRPPYIGGLGFGMKWDMGWMHDTLLYMTKDPIHRKYHHNKLSFRGLYMFTENFVLPLSHDEVVHGKGSLFGKMAGDEWQKYANLRLLFGYMFTQPGKKLLFMGGELAQWSEWDHESSIDWAALEYENHEGVQRWVRDLNTFYRGEPALYETDFTPEGWRWIDADDSDNSVLTYLRLRKDGSSPLLMACNFTPVPRHGYRIGVPHRGHWREVLNSNAAIYGGTDEGNFFGCMTQAVAHHGFDQSLLVDLPPLAMVVFKQ